MSERLRVLLLAEQCNPDWPSLPVVGYKAAMAIAEVADVTLATQVRNEPAISAAGSGDAEMVYIDSEAIARPLDRALTKIRGDEGSWTLAQAFGYPSYLLFEHMVHRELGDRIRAGEFDVIHRVTPMSPTHPSPIASLRPAEVPFVIGPLNGGLPWPSEFEAELREEREYLTKLRGVYRYLPYAKSTLKKASAILASFDHTVDQMPADARARTVDFPEVGIDPHLFNAVPREPNEQQTVLFCGRLVPYKLPFLPLDAFAASPALQRHKLVYVGDGPLEERLRERAREAGIEHCVEFRGRVTQAEVGEAMRQAEILAFPSIRELGAGVVVEAMACAMACVVADYGGPAQLIDDDRGRKIAMASREAMTASLRTELEHLVADPELAARLGEAARAHALSTYSWRAKANKSLEIYEWVLGRAPKPDFWDVPVTTG